MAGRASSVSPSAAPAVDASSAAVTSLHPAPVTEASSMATPVPDASRSSPAAAARNAASGAAVSPTTPAPLPAHAAAARSSSSPSASSSSADSAGTRPRPAAGAASSSSAAAGAEEGSSAAATATVRSSAAAAQPPSAAASAALAVVVIGMAGSGKSTFVGALQRHLTAVGKRVYTVNLDPAVVVLPYESVNIDIRDTVNYKRVMQHYRLGPNGGILTSLNLFATKFGDVLALLEQRKQTHDIILLDTPGQIEAFTWSASGSIILESLAATLPTCVCYILDTPRCCRPVTFMSNMLYACSVLYKARLPFVGVFNKTDVTSHALCQKWMTDYEAFQEALLTDETYLASLSRSSALMLVEFYSIIQTTGASSVTGAGMKGVEELLDKCRTEYETDFLPFLREKRKANEAKAKARAQAQFAKFKKDYKSSSGLTAAKTAQTAAQKQAAHPSAETTPAHVGASDSTSLKRTDDEARQEFH